MNMSDKADWLKNATLATPAVETTVETTFARPALVMSDEARIKAAREIGINRSRESQVEGAKLGYEMGGRTPAFYQDFGFGSAWLARRVVFLSQLIGSRILGRDLDTCGGLAEDFNPRTGMFEINTPSM